nr:MSMEG_1061 family FMN-dependent PPOX-type flavoprotein [Saccharomonospora sp. CUA-673]
MPIGRNRVADAADAADAAESPASGSGTGSAAGAAGSAGNAVVASEAELREVVEEPVEVISDKAAPALDAETRRFLEASPLFLLASGSREGTVEVSPRGDEGAGALVLDERTIAFADRPGNRRVDSMRNMLRNPHVGMLFLVPGTDHTVRVNGTAAIVRDPEVLERFAVKGTPPELAVVVTVREVFVHCGRAFARSKLWDPATWPSPEGLPTTGALLKAHAATRDAHRTP